MAVSQAFLINDQQRDSDMNLYPIPSDFFNEKMPLSWFDVKWGYDRGLINAHVPIKKAEDKVCSGGATEAELEMSFLMPDNIFNVSKLLDEICQKESKENDAIPARKWVFISLLWLWLNKDKYVKPLDEVEIIYSDFDYPVQIESFVKYMPPTDGYQPSKHTQQENQERLMLNWHKYLELESDVFGFQRVLLVNSH